MNSGTAWHEANVAAKMRSGYRVFLSADIRVLSFDEQDARAAGDLRASLESAGTPIGPYDLLIRTQALRTGATMVTANVSEFGRVAGLPWQDWTNAG